MKLHCSTNIFQLILLFLTFFHVNLISEIFSETLKFIEISPIFKKNDMPNKENYRPASFLSHVSKVFEEFIYKQVGDFMKE